ncbi:flagellar biosynthesis protein FliO [Aquamicrobium defluvii]|uniref:Flagellar biosynthesis protein FliO n=2 Tax=Aquamicrobium defluvii TaxID=69279 RepID=A0A4R6Y7M1_9HYPH|nr:flagellar biosynthesis protein FliO [Aquamicrobium defluvii]
MRWRRAAFYCPAVSIAVLLGVPMSEFLDSAGGSGYSAAIFWTLAALVLLLVVLIVVRMIRSMSFGTFVSGGRNRKTRLAVMDATAVDSHRRLVLVRRDDVEHLILIGGPTDVVVERDIRLAGSRRVAHAEPPAAQPPARVPVPAPAPVQPRPVQPQPSTAAPARAAPAPVAPPVARVAEPLPHVSAAAPRVSAPVPPRQPLQSAEDALDDSLASELALSLGEPAPAAPVPGPTLDDEMSRLLGELSNAKR